MLVEDVGELVRGVDCHDWGGRPVEKCDVLISAGLRRGEGDGRS